MLSRTKCSLQLNVVDTQKHRLWSELSTTSRLICKLSTTKEFPLSRREIAYRQHLAVDYI